MADLGNLEIASVPFLASLLAFVMVLFLVLKVYKAPKGSGTQVEISTQIQHGARSFLLTEYKYLAIFILVAAAFIVAVLQAPDQPDGTTDKGSWQTMVCFLVGAILSATAGCFGMMVATCTNVKTMEAAKKGLNPALQIAFSGGAVMGFNVVALGLMGLTVLWYLFAQTRDADDLKFYLDAEYTEDSTISGDGLGSIDREFIAMSDSVRYLTGFGFGASAVALFARVAGGIFTKAADVGADLVGKVQADIPEVDPRNPATIADNVGDNVGDVAGMGADLFESFVGSIIAAAVLAENRAELAFPFWIAGFGILAAVIGFFTVRTRDDATQKQLLCALHSGVYTAAILSVAFTAISTYLLFEEFNNDTTPEPLRTSNRQSWRYFGCVVIGLAAGLTIGESTEFFTSAAFLPTKSIAKAGAMGGAAAVVIRGLGVGLISCAPPVLIIVATIISCAELSPTNEVYGIALAAVGMLSTLGVILATDAYSPIADNASGIAKMTPDTPAEVRERTDKLHTLGNTAAATGKGFAIGSAVLTALALMNAYTRQVGEILPSEGALYNDDFADIDLDAALKAQFHLQLQLLVTDPLVLAGIVLGALLPFTFAALTMLSVRKAASSIVVEAQRQFRAIDGLLEGKEGAKCDSARCVATCTTSSVQAMILPGILVVFTPIIVGLLIGATALGGLLIGAISAGFLLALMMSNAGGAWDNAKKHVEGQGVDGGNMSEVHKACVVGDTVGDPFKDTSGPALNILIKLMAALSLVLAPIFTNESWSRWWYGLIMLVVMFVLCGTTYYFVWMKAPEDPVVESQEKQEAVPEKEV